MAVAVLATVPVLLEDALESSETVVDESEPEAASAPEPEDTEDESAGDGFPLPPLASQPAMVVSKNVNVIIKRIIFFMVSTSRFKPFILINIDEIKIKEKAQNFLSIVFL